MRIKTMFVGMAAMALAAPAMAQANNWDTPTEPFKLIDNVYYVGTQGIASYLFVTPDGDILIDGGTTKGADLIEANIKKLGFKLADIKILLNSHAHYDHSGGLAQLKKDTGAMLYAMEGDVSALEGGFYLGSETVKAMGAPPVKVDGPLHEGSRIRLGSTTLRANLTPGHTRGCTSWGTTVTDGGKPYELLIFCSATVAANRITPPLQYDGIIADYRKTFVKAKAMTVDIPLAPHPDFFQILQKAEKAKANPKGPNPFIAPTEFKPFIETAEVDFEKTLKDRTAAAAKPAN